ncbi:MAG: chromate transporter [Bacteroidaceae bacterium]|nr:chromate transporter [Bacteroidaceae bacterium]
MIYLQLLWVYLKIGLFGFGGGYAMLSLIQYEVVEHHQWLTSQEFTDIVAVSQMTPGPIGINSATYIGYVTTGSIWGSVLATTAVCLPSFILVLLVSKFLLKNHNNPYIKSIFSGLRPVVVGLIASAALLLMNKENFADYRAIIIAVLSLILVRKTKIHPIWVIVMAGFTGYFIY